MRSLSIAMLMIASFFMPGTASAAGLIMNAQVVAISVQGTQFAMVQFSKNMTTPFCTSINTMAVDVGTAKGRAILTLATSAMLAGNQVVVVGNGACTSSAYESIATLTVGKL